MKPKCSAVATRRLAPSWTPSGAKTELQDFAKEMISEPPQYSPLAFSRSTPSSDGLGLHRIALLRVGDAGLQRARRGDHLERRPRGLQAREGDPREGEHLAGARRQRDDAAQAPAERGDRRLLDRQRDRRAYRRRLLRIRALEHARAGEQHAAGRAEQAFVEDPLEARDADLGVGGHAERGELVAALGRDRAELADDLRRQQRGRGAIVALGQHRAVAGQQRRARGHPRDAAQALTDPEPREHEGARPVDALAGRRQHDLARDGAERPGRDVDRHAIGVAVLARLGRVDLRRGSGVHRLLVGGDEARPWHAPAIARGEPEYIAA